MPLPGRPPHRRQREDRGQLRHSRTFRRPRGRAHADKEHRAEDYDLLEAFWQGLGSVVVQMSPEEHDRALAVTSHLPHMAAAALANTITENYFRLAGTGLLDLARLASGDTNLWKQVLMQNRENVLTSLERYHAQLQALHTAIRNSDEGRLGTIPQDGEKEPAMLWEVDIYPAPGQPDLLGPAHLHGGRRTWTGRRS